jgi:hypothetical protein
MVGRCSGFGGEGNGVLVFLVEKKIEPRAPFSWKGGITVMEDQGKGGGVKEKKVRGE